MAVRSAMPWPFRWLVMAIVLGFCAAVGLWAFEFGKNIAGLDSSAKQELSQLRSEVVRLRDVEGWEAAEVCDLLGLSEVHQRVLLHRGRAKVRRALEDLLDG